MRFPALVLLIFAATLLPRAEPLLGQSAPAALKERDVKRLCEEYVKADTTEERRSKIVLELKGSDAMLAQRTLKSVFKDADKRPHALALSVTLKVPGMFKQYSPFIDTEDEAVIVELILTTLDPDGVPVLVNRFKTVELESVSYQLAFKGFTTYRLESAQLDLFFNCVKAGTRSEQAMQILRWQLDKSELTSDALLGTWPQLKLEFERNFKLWPVTGVNLLEAEGWEIQGTKRYGSNVLVGSSDYLTLKSFPAEINTAAITIRLRVLVLDGAGGSYAFLFGSYASGYIPVIEEKRWVTKDVDGSVYSHVPLTVGVWQEHVWELSSPSKEGVRTVSLKVDGKELVGNGVASKPFFAMMFKGDGSTFLIGGYELIVKK